MKKLIFTISLMLLSLPLIESDRYLMYTSLKRRFLGKKEGKNPADL